MRKFLAVTGASLALFSTASMATANANTTQTPGISKSGYYHTSKIAHNFHNDNIPLHVNSASVLSHDKNSTLILTLNKTETLNSFKKDMKINASDYSVIAMEGVNKKATYHFSFNLKNNKLSIFDENSGKEINPKTAIRVNGKNVSIDFPSSIMPIDYNSEFLVSLMYGTSLDSPESDAKTKGFQTAF